MSSVAALDECERRYRDAAGERDRLSAVLSQVSAEAAGLRQRLADSKESSEGRESSYEDRYQKLKQDLEMAVSLNEKQNALTITLEAKVEELKRQLSVQSAQVISFQQQEEVFKHEFLKLLGNFWRSVSGKYGTLDVRRDNWFNLSHSDANRIDQIIQSAAEILSAVSCRLGGGAPQSQFRPGLPSSSTVGLGATPSRSPPPAEVSHHYRHWHSGGVTKSPLTKANQAYVEAVSRGLETNHSPSLLSRSLSQPFTREEFRRSGGSKSFTGLDERVSPQRLSLQRDSMGTSRDILAGNHSEILNRLQKAKTAYSFMRSDSLVDFQS